MPPAYYIETSDKERATAGHVSARDLATGRVAWKRDYDWARRTEQVAYGYDRIVFEMRNPADWKGFTPRPRR